MQDLHCDSLNWVSTRCEVLTRYRLITLCGHRNSEPASSRKVGSQLASYHEQFMLQCLLIVSRHAFPKVHSWISILISGPFSAFVILIRIYSISPPRVANPRAHENMPAPYGSKPYVPTDAEPFIRAN